MAVEVGLYCLSWLAALTPDISMIPPDDLFAEMAETRQEQEWNFTIAVLPNRASHMHSEGIQGFRGQKMERSDASEAEGTGKAEKG